MARSKSPRDEEEDDDTSSTFCAGFHVSKLVAVSIGFLTGMSLFSQTRVIHNTPVLERVTNALMLNNMDTNSVNNETTDPGKYPPFSCSKVLNDLKVSKYYQALDPNGGKVHSRRTTTDPPFYISLHHQKFDKTRWGIMETGHYYERQLTAAFRQVLSDSPPGARVLDVGGNIGFFTLFSAAQGSFTIDAFEPNLKNRLRFCESLNLNRWYRTEFNTHNILHEDTTMGTPIVNLYSYGVGQEEGHFMFVEHSNPGQGAFTMNQKVNASHPMALQLVTLDNFAQQRGWFSSRPDIAILKVDVEGFEYSVFEGAKKLLKANMIRNIFTEISVRTKPERASNIPCLNYLSQAGYRLHQIGGWSGPSIAVNWPNDEHLVDKILNAAAKEGAKQLNLWWTLAGNTTTQS